MQVGFHGAFFDGESTSISIALEMMDQGCKSVLLIKRPTRAVM